MIEIIETLIKDQRTRSKFSKEFNRINAKRTDYRFRKRMQRKSDNPAYNSIIHCYINSLLEISRDIRAKSTLREMF